MKMNISTTERKAVTADIALNAMLGMVLGVVGFILATICLITIVHSPDNKLMIVLLAGGTFMFGLGIYKFFTNYKRWERAVHRHK